MTVIGSIAVALIGVVPAVLTSMNRDGGDVHSTPITELPITEIQSKGVSIDDAKLSDSRTALALWGSAPPFVEEVRVEVGEPNAKVPILTAETNVTDGKWSLVATSDQQIPKPFELKASYRERPVNSGEILKASYVTFKREPPPPPPPPGQDSGCPPDTAGGCPGEPGWSAPSIYRSES